MRNPSQFNFNNLTGPHIGPNMLANMCEMKHSFLIAERRGTGPSRGKTSRKMEHFWDAIRLS